MFTTTSRVGAAATRRTAKRSPLELLVSLIDEDPQASKERLWNKWQDIVEREDEYRIPALRHCFTNLYEALERDRRKPKLRRATAADKEVQEKRVQALEERVKQALLMNLRLPNGKKLSEATFADCAKAGGWFMAVSKLGKPNQIVGEHVTEEKLRALQKG